MPSVALRASLCVQVTGANKGIGKEIVRQLAAQGLTAVLTARNEAAGSAAAKELSADLSLSVPFHQARLYRLRVTDLTAASSDAAARAHPHPRGAA